MARKRRRETRPKLTARGRGLVVVSSVAVAGGALGAGAVSVQLGLVGIGILLVARVWCAANLRRVRVSRAVPATAICGADFDLTLEVRNTRRWLAARSLVVADRFLPFHERGVTMEALPAGGRSDERFRTRLVGRGRVYGVGYRVESSFPLGLFRMARRRRGGEEMLVYPRPVLPEALRGAGFAAVEDEAGAAPEPARQGELRGVREFQRGDPLKHIVWPAFARTGQLAVREFDRPLPERYSLLFHSFCPPGKMIWPEAFEHALGLLAGLLFLGRDQNVPLDLTAAFTGWERFQVDDPRDLSRPLELLALAAHEPAGELGEVSKALLELPGSHPVFVVSEAPVRFWADRLPDVGRTVTCLDTTTMRVKKAKPGNFRRVA